MSRVWRWTLGVGIGTTVCGIAVAQSPERLPAADPAAVWALQGENSSISTSGLTDRYYTNGLRLGFTSATADLPSFAATFGHAVLGDGQQRLTIDLSQQIFTAKDTTSYDPPPGDRPFAGLLLATLGLLQDTDTTRSTLGLSVGMIGPSALGQSVQNGFHTLIGQDTIHGWGTQLHDEPVFELSGSRVWRIPLGRLGDFETDVLPDAAVGLGTVRVYAETGAQVRIGQGLDADFGAPRLRPGPSGGDAFARIRPFAWYAFAGGSGQVVGHDVTLNGNTWRDSRSVTVQPLVGELHGGLALMAWGMRLSYTHVFQTQEFKHQKGGLHQFGSLALSVRF